jgi:hypothetical protein
VTEPTRWGGPLDFATAEGLARRWNDGHVISETERWGMFAEAIYDVMDKADKESRYYTLGEIRSYMEEKGLLALEADIDDNLLQHTVCEADCARKCKDKTGPDADNCFWGCMEECTPVKPAIPQEGNPDYNPSPVDPALLSPTSYSLAPSGLLIPKHGKKT